MLNKKKSQNIEWPENKYKILFEKINEVVLLIDRKGRIVDINSAVKRMSGFSPKAIKGHNFKDFKFINLKDRRKIARYFRKRLKGIKAPFHYEIEVATKTGKRIIIEISAGPFIIKGKIIGSLAILRNVTNQKKAQEKIKLFSDAVAGTIDAIGITDMKGNFTYTNLAMEKLYGYKKREMIGKYVGDLNLKREIGKKILSSLIKTGRWSGEVLQQKKNKKIFPAILSLSIINDEKGKPMATMGTVKDITELKQTENMLRESEEKLRNIFISSPDAITVTDLDGNIIKCNQATLDMHGFSQKKELIGKSAFDLIVQREHKKALKDMKQTLNQGFLKNIEYTFLTKDGHEFPAELSASIIQDSSGKPIAFIAITKDISERKQIDHIKNEFISLASHQLRTPLTIMNWYSEMLLDGKAGKLNEQQKKYSEEIYFANQRLVKLVNHLLNISRMELGSLGINPEPANLIGIADEMLNELLPQIKNKKLTIVKNCKKDLPVINIDQNVIRIIFQNLLSNAIKYTPKGGRVKILIKKQKSNVFIKVSDTGYGIPKAQQSQIFSKFFRANNIKEEESEGSGLGLSIVKLILEQSGGKIWFESEENKGTTFFVSIPLKGVKKKKGKKMLTS